MPFYFGFEWIFCHIGFAPFWFYFIVCIYRCEQLNFIFIRFLSDKRFRFYILLHLLFTTYLVLLLFLQFQKNRIKAGALVGQAYRVFCLYSIHRHAHWWWLKIGMRLWKRSYVDELWTRTVPIHRKFESCLPNPFNTFWPSSNSYYQIGWKCCLQATAW